MRIELAASNRRLFNGRQSFYFSFAAGRRHWFISRWDTARVTPHGPRTRARWAFDLWRGRVMTWYAGTWTINR